MRHRRLDALIECPTFERLDAMFQFFVPLRVVRQRFKLRDQVEHRLRTIVDVLINRLRRIQHEILWQIADDEIAPP